MARLTYEFILSLLMVIICAVIVAECRRLHASPYSSPNTEYLNLELKRLPYQRDYLFPEVTKWDYEVSLNFKSNFGRFYLESDLTGQTTGSRFRNIWWDYTLGLRIIEELDLIWDHRSQHAMDWDVEDFPVRDSYGIRLNFID